MSNYIPPFFIARDIIIFLVGCLLVGLSRGRSSVNLALCARSAICSVGDTSSSVRVPLLSLCYVPDLCLYSLSPWVAWLFSYFVPSRGANSSTSTSPSSVPFGVLSCRVVCVLMWYLLCFALICLRSAIVSHVLYVALLGFRLILCLRLCY